MNIEDVWEAFAAKHPGVYKDHPEVMAAFYDFLAGARWFQKEAEQACMGEPVIVPFNLGDTQLSAFDYGTARCVAIIQGLLIL